MRRKPCWRCAVPMSLVEIWVSVWVMRSVVGAVRWRVCLRQSKSGCWSLRVWLSGRTSRPPRSSLTSMLCLPSAQPGSLSSLLPLWLSHAVICSPCSNSSLAVSPGWLPLLHDPLVWSVRRYLLCRPCETTPMWVGWSPVNRSLMTCHMTCTQCSARPAQPTPGSTLQPTSRQPAALPPV